MKKRLLAFLLVLCMCCALFPAAAFASEEPAASSEAASEEVQTLSASLVFTYPDGIDEDEVTIELYAGFPTSSSKTLDVMIEDGELSLIPEEDGYTITEAGTYSYHISGDGYYNILKIFNITEEDIASGEIVIEVTGGKVGETDGYQPTVVPENAPDTYSMDSRDAMLCIWPDEILENFTVEDQGYETPAFDGTDAAHEFTTQEELEEFLADRDESCDYMYLYSAGTTPNYEMDIPLVIFTETEIPEDATLEEAAELVTANGKPTVWYQAQIHPNEPAAGEGALVIIDDFVNDEETAALLENVNVIVVPRINPDGSYLFTRVTYDGFDMNRDHMALKAEELAQLHTAYRLFMAEVVIDGHEFTFYGANADGYMRQADDVETTPATSLNDDEEVTALGLEMAAYAFETAEDAGLRIYHYGTTTNNPIGRAYFGLYNCLSFLVETRGIGAGKTNFERRVYSQETVVMSYITYTAEHADEIVETVAAAREETIEKGKTYDEDELLALYQTASGDTLTDYEGTRVQYNMDGTVYSEETNALELNDAVVRSRTRPTAYVLPADLENIEEILYVIDNQGIEYYTLDPGTTVTLQQYYYVGPYMIDEETERGIEADLYEATEVTFENGAYVFPMDQVGANILAMLMEPDVTDSVGYDGTLYQYGLISYDEETGDFPIYRYTGDNPRETLVSNAGEAASDETSAEASEEAADTLSVEDAYVEYIHEWLLAELEVNSSLTEDQVENEFMPLIEAGDYVSFPAEMLYGGMLESGTAMTFEEFAAQY
ncbi:MAG: M14 family metallocarboxypeptidase [Oscillospiraceae bacterium]|nr:M14 family metallocarboxypeptidase [Oscillospiraceae bacterium]